MSPLRILNLSLIVVVLAQDADETVPTPQVEGQRVILHIGRDREVRGHITLEDKDVIVVRRLDSTLESYSKSRVLKIVRLVDPKPGQTGVVIMRNGQRRVGVILEDSFDQVRLGIDGITTILVRETVDQVLLHPTFDQRYERYRSAARTPSQKLQFCQWLVHEHRYSLASRQLSELMQQAPGPEARQLLKIVNAQLALAPDARDEGDPLFETGPETHDEDDPDADRLPSLVLTFDDVNLIRVYELDFDRPPKVAVAPETIRQMIERYGASSVIPASQLEQRALYRADPLEIVEMLFTLKARDLYPQVDVISEPFALNLFRRRVHNAWLLNNCATTRCHGGVSAGRLFLHRRGYRDERVRYTNLLILQRLELDPDWPLVNYDEPMMSLIVQYGLPRHLARQPHPDVSGWKRVIGRGGQRMLRDTVPWIESMMQPRPEYPVEYEPPRMGPLYDPSPGDDGTRTPR